jgi:hypothetical protein
MDLSTITKKLKNLQYVSKIDFQKDLELIWSNCFTFNALPDSIYRVHATKMKERATNLLQKIPDIHIRNAADLSDSEDDSKAVDLTPTSDMEVQSLKPVIELHGGQSPLSCQDTHPSGKEEEYGPLDEQFDLQRQLMYDNDYLVKLWKTKTFNQRVLTLKDRAEQFMKPFAERKSIRRSLADLNYYNQQVKLCLKRNRIRSEVLYGSHIDNEDLDIFDYYNLPELSIMACYPSSPYLPHKSGDLASFFLDEDDISPFIPPAPPQSLSEYPQYNIDLNSPLNQGILN